MNSDTYQHKQVSTTGDSHSAGQEMETGKDISNVSHKHTLLIMAGSLLALLVWIAMAGHSGGGGGQYVTATLDELAKGTGGVLAAEYQVDTVNSALFDKDIFSLDSELGSGSEGAAENCAALVAAVNPNLGSWCKVGGKSSFTSHNKKDYCWDSCKAIIAGSCKMYGSDFTSIASAENGIYCIGNCHKDKGSEGIGGNLLCQKCPKIVVPPPVHRGKTWCSNGGAYNGQDGKHYCWSTCDFDQYNIIDQCDRRKGFFVLLDCQSHNCPGGGRAKLCQIGR